MKNALSIISFLFLSVTVYSQQINPLLVENDLENQQKWVDSIYSEMTLNEKIGQLFMVDVFSSDPVSKTDKIKKLINENHIGGIIFSRGGPRRQAKLNNEFQSLSKVPLMVGMDAEWGLAMRLDSTFAYPWNMTLGAISDNQIIEKVGRRIGEHSKRLGVHINFAPVVDINTNPKNPIIGNRSFGEDKINVTEKSIAFMKGMQSAGILANAKHFPGHGDTDTDSHKTLPTIDFSLERIEDIELYPYTRMFREGLASVMVAHLSVPALEPRPNYPSSISPKVVHDLLIKELGFNGLVFTDALNMKGASNFKEPGQIDLAAFLAGNDVLLISEDVPKAQALIAEAYNSGIISEQRLSLSVKKILMAKYMVGLNDYKPVIESNLFEDLNTVLDDALYEEAMENALTVLKNKKTTLPIKELKGKKFAYVNFGDDSGEAFYNELQKYDTVDWIKADDLGGYIEQLEDYDTVIIGFHKSNENPWKEYDFTDKEIAWLSEIARTNTVILDVFARPYALLKLNNIKNYGSIIMSYQNSEISQRLSAQLIFGARKANGKLPVSLGKNFPLDTCIMIETIGRLQYGTPESVGMNSAKLNRSIDSLANLGIIKNMMPGAQILVARKGKVIFNKTYGYQTPQEKRAVEKTDIYDLASMTKILATLPLIMELVDKDVISLDTRLSQLLPEYKKSNKANLTIKEILTHTAGLQAWIPFYTETLDSKTKKPSSKYYTSEATKNFDIEVSENLYMRHDYRDTIFEEIRKSDLRKQKGYKYSDLPYYILKKYLEEYYDRPLEKLVQSHFYETLGADNTTYLPLNKFNKEIIAPTEEDNRFRMQRVQGYVNDQGAAMIGGVGGHAGLFSNANDVAKIMQMYLWEGTYGGIRYFSADTFNKFNTCYFCSQDIRRGVGFDKPQLGESGPTCGCVPKSSFGHSGFTGTLTWADPEEEIVYVFLSNRTYPDPENRKIIYSDLRSNIQQAIYDAIDINN